MVYEGVTPVRKPIVIQESNPTQRALLHDIVDDAYRGPVQTFEPFEECRQFVEQRRVALLFLQLIPADGERVQWIGEFPDPTVGVVNWEWSEEDLERFVQAGLDDYVFKPYQPERLTDLVNGWTRAVKHGAGQDGNDR